ncbi:hypothetical protein PGTDC60_1412 [Porphyromonas gingivalis TDC60]|nr:hypothetical protein PGTDC60_1412 [Porphyromonas gingivalis TDC60]
MFFDLYIIEIYKLPWQSSLSQFGNGDFMHTKFFAAGLRRVSLPTKSLFSACNE